MSGRPPTDLQGQRFARLVAVSIVRGHGANGGKRVRAKWVCRCDCGKTTTVLAQSLTSGLTRSCGCLRAEVNSKAALLRLARTRATRESINARRRARYVPRAAKDKDRKAPQCAPSQAQALAAALGIKPPPPAAGRVHIMRDEP